MDTCQTSKRMRKIFIVSILLSYTSILFAQNITPDSLKHLLKTEKSDTMQVRLLNELARTYLYSKPDTALILAQEALNLSSKNGYIKGEAHSLNQIANTFSTTGNYVKALKINIDALKKAEAISDEQMISQILSNIGTEYALQDNYRQSVGYYLKSLAISQRLNDINRTVINISNLGDAYRTLGMLDSAKYYTARGYAMSRSLKDDDLIGTNLTNYGNIYSRLGNADSAMIYYRQGFPYFGAADDDDGFCESYLGMAAQFRKKGQPDSALHYAKLSLAAGWLYIPCYGCYCFSYPILHRRTQY